MKKKLKKKIKIHAYMLLCLYGVKEKKIKDNPEALNSFVDLLTEDINNLTKK